MSENQSKNIYQRLIEVQKKVTSVTKNETVKMSEKDKGYKAVTHDDVAAVLHTPLAEAGIVLLPTVTSHTISDFEVQKYDNYNKREYKQKWYRTDLSISVKWINADNPEDFIESSGSAYALDTSDKSFAKAYSLALKIILLKVHLLESRDEEEQRPFDQDPKTENKPSQSQQQKPPAKPGANPQQQKQNQPNQSSQGKPPMQNHAPGGLTQDQLKRLYAIGLGRGWSSEYLRMKIYNSLKKTPSQLDYKQYEAMCSNFETRAFTAKDKAELDHYAQSLDAATIERITGKKSRPQDQSEPPVDDSPIPDYENEPQ